MPKFNSTADTAAVCFHVPKMLCGSTASAVADAVRQLDSSARVRIDLPMRRIEIEPAKAEPAAYREALENAGLGAVRQWPSELAHMLSEPFSALFGPGARDERGASTAVPVPATLPGL